VDIAVMSDERLDTRLDGPSLILEIEGREYRFGELDVDRRAGLQAYLRRAVPHPLDSIKAHLDGFSESAQAVLLENARQDAKKWPPNIDTGAGRTALLADDLGQIEALHVGMSMHHPGATREDAERLYKALDRDARRGQKTIARIYCVMFGRGDPEVEDPVPKSSGPDRTRASIGAGSSAPASNGSG
jgi:hypothetical protein